MNRRDFIQNSIKSTAALLAIPGSETLFSSLANASTVYRLKCFTLFPSTMPIIGQQLVQFRNRVFEESQGMISLEFTGELETSKVLSAKSNEYLQKLIEGEFDLAIAPPFSLRNMLAQAEYFGQWPTTRSQEELEDWFSSASVQNFWADQFAEINLKPFHFGRALNGGLWSKSPIQSLNDIGRLNPRILGRAHAAPVVNSVDSEKITYLEMKQKIADGSIKAFEGFSPYVEEKQGLTEKFPYFYKGTWPNSVSYLGLFVNNNSFGKLDRSAQNILTRSIRKSHVAISDSLLEADRGLLESLEESEKTTVSELPTQLNEMLIDQVIEAMPNELKNIDLA